MGQILIHCDKRLAARRLLRELGINGWIESFRLSGVRCKNILVIDFPFELDAWNRSQWLAKEGVLGVEPYVGDPLPLWTPAEIQERLSDPM